MKELGTFAFGVGGMAWLSLNLQEEALVIIGLVGIAIGIFCGGWQWAKYKSESEE